MDNRFDSDQNFGTSDEWNSFQRSLETMSAKVSNALVSVLDKNNQLSDAEKIQLKNK